MHLAILYLDPEKLLTDGGKRDGPGHPCAWVGGGFDFKRCGPLSADQNNIVVHPFHVFFQLIVHDGVNLNMHVHFCMLLCN